MNTNPLSQSFHLTQSNKLLFSIFSERYSQYFTPPKVKHFRLFIFVVLSLLFTAQSHANQALRNLKPGHWYRFPNSQMKPVTPPNDSNYDWRFYSRNVMDAWSGGAYDTDKNRLIVWGGGHGDYAGNEVYAFDLETGKWKRLTSPSPLKPGCNTESREGCSEGETMSDGQPVSRHTYDSLEYLPNKKALWSQGGSRWIRGACSTATWTIDLVNNNPKWVEKANIPACSGVFTVFSAYDSSNGKIFSFGNNVLLSYDSDISESGAWKSVTQNHPDLNTDKLTAAINPNPDTHKMIAVGNVNLDLQDNVVLSYDLSDIDHVTFKEVITHGDTEITECEGPGFDYDSKSKQLVAWCDDPDKGLFANDIYVLNINPDTNQMTWTKESPATDNLVNAPRIPPESRGTYGRFRYVPKYDVFVLVNSTTQDVYAYKRKSSKKLLDADGNGTVDALTDGILFIRYMLGIRDDALINGVVAEDCTRCSSVEIEDYIRQSANTARLDIDGNGETDALTDGTLINRFLFGISGPALIADSVGENCTRCTADKIRSYLETLN
jgi:hypothetical protein